jgi:hypothetical protein
MWMSVVGKEGLGVFDSIYIDYKPNFSTIEPKYMYEICMREFRKKTAHSFTLSDFEFRLRDGAGARHFPFAAVSCTAL